MSEYNATSQKSYNLETRSLSFARDVGAFINALPKTTSNFEYSKQVIRSSGSIGANYIEANEALSKKDLIMRLRIAKKEAKETIYWLSLIQGNNEERNRLLKEANELMNILGAIIIKCQ